MSTRWLWWWTTLMTLDGGDSPRLLWPTKCHTSVTVFRIMLTRTLGKRCHNKVHLSSTFLARSIQKSSESVVRTHVPTTSEATCLRPLLLFSLPLWSSGAHITPWACQSAVCLHMHNSQFRNTGVSMTRLHLSHKWNSYSDPIERPSLCKKMQSFTFYVT